MVSRWHANGCLLVEDFFSATSVGAISADKLAVINTWLSSMLFHTSLPTRYGTYLGT